MNLREAKHILEDNDYLVENEEGNYYSVTICYTDTNGEIATKTKIEFTDNDNLAETQALAWFKKKIEYDSIRWIDSKKLEY